MTESSKVDLSAAKDAVKEMSKKPNLAEAYGTKPVLNPEAIGASL